MKQIAVLSGKGGTGKTTITAAFASLMENGLFADCDVDAPDLHLIFQPDLKEKEKFSGLKLAYIDPEVCTSCMECVTNCKFNAISDTPMIDPLRCEGCSVCTLVCPVEAITMSPRDSGYLYFSSTRFGPLVHARLNIAEEASGKLVSKVRERAKTIAEKEGHDHILIDGPPGIGCPVIATLGGVDLAVVITEPTVSGHHDLERVVKTARFFKIPVGVVINKFDLNEKNAHKIDEYCKNQDIELFGLIPYDDSFTKAMVEGKTVVEQGPESLVTILKEIWDKICSKLGGGDPIEGRG